MTRAFLRDGVCSVEQEGTAPKILRPGDVEGGRVYRNKQVEQEDTSAFSLELAPGTTFLQSINKGPIHKAH